MTKKDCKAIASIVGISTLLDTQIMPNGNTEYLIKGMFLDRLCEYLETDNPHFDRDKFVEACK